MRPQTPSENGAAPTTASLPASPSPLTPARGKDGRSLLALGGGAGPCDIREVVVHEYDKSSKWLFPRHGDSILRLAGIRRMERW